MSQHHAGKHQRSVRRIVLPSGRAIDVIGAADRIDVSARPGLHVCPSCRSELVQPVEWGVTQGQHWKLRLRCPNCGWSRHGSYGHEQVADLEERLDDGIAAILDDLKRLTDANMADEVDRFAAALEADLILPEDF